MTRSRLYLTVLAAVIIAVAAVAPRAAVNAQPTPFDQQFIDMMVPHHEGAVRMAREELATGENPKLRRLAEEIIAAQRREIDQMRLWRKKWYGSATGRSGQPPGY